MSATYAKEIQDKATVKAMIKNDPEGAVEIIENRIRTINYLENQKRTHILDFVAAKVKGEILPSCAVLGR